jgi:glycosyltransferase involved in cell wall biosynthesis
MNELISIIIPNFNRGSLIGETLESVLAQEYTHWECIIVDDGSTDDSEKIILSYLQIDSRFRYYKRPSELPKGANSCRNYGFELTVGHYINWFDSDDIMLPDYLSVFMENFEGQNELIIVTGSYADATLQNKYSIVLNEKADLFKDYILWKLQILTPSILFRKSFLKNHSLFSYSIARGQESELFSRLFFNLPKSAYKIINKPVFLYRQHVDTKTAKNKAYVPVYKESEAYIYLENIRKAIELRDEEIFVYCYRQLINIFFMGIVNGHKSNARKIANDLTVIFVNENRIRALNFSILTELSLRLPKGLSSLKRKIERLKPVCFN